MDESSPPGSPEDRENASSEPEGIWGLLTRPHASIREAERRRARLLSSLLVILVLAGIASVILSAGMGEPASDLLITSLSLLMLAMAYGLSRTEYYSIAVALTMLTIWVSVLDAAVIRYHNPDLFNFLILGTLLSGQFLSPRTTLLISAASVAAILLLPWPDPLITIHQVIVPAFLVGLSGALATVAASMQRRDIDHIKQQSQQLSEHVTNLMRSQEALQRSETRLNNILENAAEAIIAVNESQNIILFNHGAEAIFGYEAGEILGQPLDRLIPSRHTGAHRRHVDAFGADGTTSRNMHRRQEVLGMRKDGSEFPAQVGISTYVEAGQKISTAILNDVTARKLAEEQIRRHTERTQALAEISQLIVEVGLDYQAIMDAVTRRVAELVGDACFISLLSDDGRQMELASIFHAKPGAVDPLREKFVTTCSAGYEDLHRRVIETGQPISMDDLPEHEVAAAIRTDDQPDLEQYGLYSMVVVPLRAQDRVIGTLSLCRDQEGRAYEEDERVFLREIADRTALAITNAQLFEKAQHHLNKLQGLREIDLAITGSMDLQIVLGTVLDQLRTQLSVDAASVLLLNPHTMMLDYGAGKGFRTQALRHEQFRLGQGYAGRAAQERRLTKIADLRHDQTDVSRSAFFHAEAFVSYCAVPLLAKGQVKGVLEVFQRSSLGFNQEWIDFLEALAGQAAIAIDNNGLFDDLQRSNHELVLAYDATIEGWSRALDLRDKETEGHTQRVAEKTLRLAEAFGVRSTELVHIRRGALLHDIGKMGIPDRILLKPGPLNEEEWVLMRKHPQLAYEMLAPISYLRPALDIPYGHHEKWDGSGYPRGLGGKAIPLAARIFAVVDVWDALSSERPYRPAWPEEKIREYLEQQKGEHFDPEVVDAFFRLMAMRAGG
ncbi:MAG TPA: HD domain-containing phosphohydrolase [Anaerolineales bacterium]